MKKLCLFAFIVFLSSFQHLVANCPVTVISNGATVICQGDSVMLIASGATTYNWSNGGSLSSNVGDTVMASPNFTTTYTVTGHCGFQIGFATITITVHPKPVASFITAPNNNVCSGTAVNFTSNVFNGTPPYTYAWTFGGGGTSNVANPAHTFTTLGCGNVVLNNQLIVTDANGCKDTVINPITILQAPDVQLADANVLSPFSNCLNNPSQSNPNDTITVNNISPSAGCITTYNINWGDGNTQNGLTGAVFPLQHIYTALGAFNIVVTAIGANGCTGTATYLVANQSNPAGGLSTLGSTSGCGPITLPFLINNWQSNSPGTTYNLDFGDGTSILLTHPLNAGLTQDTVYHTYTTSSCPGSTFFTATLTVTNACSNTAYTASNIQIRTKPVAGFTAAPTPACALVPVCFTNTTVAGYGPNCVTGTIYAWNFGDPGSGAANTSALQTPPCHTYAAAGTYTITLTASNGCGASTVTQQICVTPQPTPAFTLNNNTGCAPLNVAATNTSNTLNNCVAATYLWTINYTASPPCAVASSFVFTGGTTATSTNPSFTFTNAGTYTLTLAVTNPCGTFTTSQNIVVKGPPIVTMTAIPGSCGPATVSPTATVTNCGTNAPTYVWTFGGGVPNNSVLAAPPPITFAGNGNHTITVSVTNECGTTPANTAFVVHPQPTANAGNPVAICAGQSTNLNGTAAGGTPAYTYSWTSNPVGFGSAIANPAVTPAATTTYILTVTDANLCTATSQVVVTVNPLPVVAVNSPTICVGATATLTATGATTYLWSNASVLNPINVTPVVTTNYTVTGTITATGCSATATSTVTVNPLPVVNAGPNVTLCNQPIPYTLTGFTPVGGTWSGAGVTAGGIFTPTVAGNFTLTYSYTDPITTCTNTATMVVTVVAPQTANAGTGFIVCANAPIVNLVGFTPAGGTLTGTGIVGTTFNPATAGVGAFILTYSFGVGTCLSTDTIMVTVNSIPTVAVNSPTICAGQTAVLTATGGNTYSWSTGPIINPINVTPAATTNYTVTGTTTATGCSAQATSTVTVNPLPVVNAGANVTLCNQPIPYTLTGFAPVGGTWSGAGVTPGGVFTPTVNGNFTLTYTYTNAATTCTNSATVVVTVVNPQVANAGTGFNVCINASIVNLVGYTPVGGTWTGTGIVGNTFNPATAGAGTFILTYSFGAGTCLSTDTIMVTVNPQPLVGVNSATICAGQTAVLTATGANTYSWSNGGINNPHNVTPAATTNYTVTGTTTATGCSNTAISIVTVNPLPVVNAGANVTLCNQPIPYTLTGFAPVGGVWTGAGVTAAGVFTPTAVGNFTLTYTYTNAVTTCSNSATIVVTVVNPQVANAGTGFNVCINAPIVNLVGFTPAGGTWTGTGIAGNTFNPATAGAGAFILTYSFGAGTCLSTDTIMVTVNPQPIVGVNSPTICAGQTAVLTATGANTYSWSNGSLINPTNVVPAATTNYTVTGTTTATGCSNTAISTVTVNPLPVVNAGVGQTYCNQPSVITLAGYAPAGGTWTGVGIINGALGTFDPSVPPIGNNVLTYTYTNANGCTNSATITNTIMLATPTNAGPDDVICLNNGLLNLAGWVPLTASWTGTGITNPTGVFDPLVSGVGTFTLTLTNGAGTCLTTDTKLVTVQPLPVINPGVNEITCISTAPYNLTGFTPLAGTWTGTGITNGALATFNPATAGAGVFTLTYTYTDPITNCTNTGTKTITVGALPVVAFTNPAVDCINSSVAFVNNITGATSYAWNFGDGGTSVSAAPSHIYVTHGIYTIQQIAYSPLGCSDSITNTIQINNVPVATFTTLPNTGCAPLSVVFTDNSTGVITSYLWNFGNGNTSANAVAPNQTYQHGIYDTTYFVSLAATNNCGTSVFNDTILVQTPPIVGFGINLNSACSPFPVLMNNTTTGSPSTYVWSFGDFTPNSTLANPPPHPYFAAIADSTYIITLIATNGCGADTISRPLLILHNNVTAFFNTSPANGCAPHQVNFTDFSTGATFVSWDFGDGITTAAINPSHTYLLPGTYIAREFADDGCDHDTASVTITIYAPPVMSFTTNITCANQPVNFTNTSTGAQGYTWDFGDGGTSAVNNPTHIYAVGGTYNVKLVGTSGSNGCLDSITQAIVVNALPIPHITANDTIGCIALVVNFTNTTTNAAFYHWDFGDGNTSIQQSPTHIYMNTGVYQVNMVATNVAGCSDSAQMQINVYPNPIAAFTVSGVYSCAFPQAVNFTNNSTGAAGYLWNFGNGATSPLTNPSETYMANGVYNISLIATNTFGCADTATNTFTVYQPPVISFAPSATSGCAPLMINFANTTANGVNYIWNFGDNSTSTANTPSHIFVNAGTYTVTLISSNATPCADTVVQTNLINVSPSPIAGFTVNPQETSVLNSEVTMTDHSISAASCETYWGDGSSDTDCGGTHRYANPGTYQIMQIVTNTSGCKDTAYQTVIIDADFVFYIPNSFTPDGNGVNDEFYGKGTGIKTFTMDIWDRWGTLIKHSESIDDHWDGTYLGKTVKEDVYVYQIKIVDVFYNDHKYLGKVTVVR